MIILLPRAVLLSYEDETFEEAYDDAFHIGNKLCRSEEELLHFNYVLKSLKGDFVHKDSVINLTTRPTVIVEDSNMGTTIVTHLRKDVVSLNGTQECVINNPDLIDAMSKQIISEHYVFNNDGIEDGYTVCRGDDVGKVIAGEVVSDKIVNFKVIKSPSNVMVGNVGEVTLRILEVY